MIEIYNEDFWKIFASGTATLIVGILGFTSTILALIFSNLNTKRNLNFLLEKDKRDREDKLKRDELDFAKDKYERQKAYNRVLGSFLKLYHSYLQHQYIFNENGLKVIPDEYLLAIVEKIDNLDVEILLFKKIVSEESAILPELTIYLHEIQNLLSRFVIVAEQFSKDNSDIEGKDTKLLIQRAHSYAVKEMLDEYFEDLIEKLAIKADVSEDFLNEIRKFNSDETIEKNMESQSEIMKRFFESLSKQTGQNITDNDFL